MANADAVFQQFRTAAREQVRLPLAVEAYFSGETTPEQTREETGRIAAGPALPHRVAVRHNARELGLSEGWSHAGPSLGNLCGSAGRLQQLSQLRGFGVGVACLLPAQHPDSAAVVFVMPARGDLPVAEQQSGEGTVFEKEVTVVSSLAKCLRDNPFQVKLADCKCF